MGKGDRVSFPDASLTAVITTFKGKFKRNNVFQWPVRLVPASIISNFVRVLAQALAACVRYVSAPCLLFVLSLSAPCSLFIRSLTAFVRISALRPLFGRAFVLCPLLPPSVEVFVYRACVAFARCSFDRLCRQCSCLPESRATAPCLFFSPFARFFCI